MFLVMVVTHRQLLLSCFTLLLAGLAVFLIASLFRAHWALWVSSIFSKGHSCCSSPAMTAHGSLDPIGLSKNS
jgi:hypothetical protein